MLPNRIFFDNFLEIGVVAKAFKGIKIAVGVLIVRAGLNLWKKVKKEKQSYMIMYLAFLIMVFGSIFSVKISTIVLILASGILGILCYKYR